MRLLPYGFFLCKSTTICYKGSIKDSTKEMAEKKIRINWKQEGVDKYYLCDAAYTNTRGFMTPYRNTRYWLADFRRQRALTNEEKFNHAHAQLRNVIERAYGVLKARFPILKQMAPFSFTIQRDIVRKVMASHDMEWGSQGIEYMTTLRDEIATQLMSNG
ncbi:uncharacterized protein LOC110875825 [Helianthus annuus]|uniref:uncharacterized protein LOC110875825 n=1 Tax=Helianthus annuus TaxID=4232 RepID=UPI000B8FC1C6|nr:uncharacterized protein LOC110875825 [Helianthus annuus]